MYFLRYFLVIVLLHGSLSALSQKIKKKGKFTEKWGNKNLKVSGHFKNYKRDGTWLHFTSVKNDTSGIETYVNGLLNGRFFRKYYWGTVKGNYVIGSKTGQWKYHRDYPQLDSVCNYAGNDSTSFEYTAVSRKKSTRTLSGSVQNGKREGKVNLYEGNLDVTGKQELLLEGYYQQGLRTGMWRTFRKGRVVSERYFSFDTLRRSETWGYADTILMKRSDSLLQEDGRTWKRREIAYFNGRDKMILSVYKNNLPDSIWLAWYYNGQVRYIKPTLNGKAEGIFRSWHVDGSLESETNYKQDKREGIAYERRINGVLNDSGLFVNDRKEGIWKERKGGYKEEPTMMNGIYKKGNKDGKFTVWYMAPDLTKDGKEGKKKYMNEFIETRQKKAEGNYTAGQLNGKYTEWYVTGKKKRETNYEMGVEKGKSISYDESGKIIESKILTGHENELMEVRIQEAPVPPVETVERDAYHQVEVDQPAEFPGGIEQLMKFLQAKIQYPQMEKEMNVQGRVYIEFVIYADGSVNDIKVLRGVPGHPAMENEAIRVIKMMPAWKAATLKGKNVKMRYQMPIKFQLQ